MLGVPIFGDEIFGGGAEEAAAALGGVDPDARWQLRAIDATDQVLSYLPSWVNGNLSLRLNEPYTLSFDYDGTRPEAAHLTGTNFIEMRDKRGDRFLLFRILSVVETFSGGGRVLSVQAEDLLGQLRDEYVREYRAENRAVADIVGDLMGMQTWARPVLLGYLHPAFGAQTASVVYESMSILQCLQDLVRQFGGFIAQGARTGQPRVFWLTNVEHAQGRRVEVGKDAVDLRIESDWSNVCTRIYAYGAGGADGARINLKRHAGQPNEYIDSANIDPDAPRSRVAVNSRITDGASLLAWAQYLLARSEDPAYRVSGGFIDLDQARVDRETYQRFVIGSRLALRIPETGVEFKVAIAAMDQSLDNPAVVRVTLADPLDPNRESAYETDRTLSRVAAPLAPTLGDPLASPAAGGGDGLPVYVEDEEEDLPSVSVPEMALARITDPEARLMIRNTDNDGWVPVAPQVDEDGNMTVDGDLHVEGDLTVDGSATVGNGLSVTGPPLLNPMEVTIQGGSGLLPLVGIPILAKNSNDETFTCAAIGFGVQDDTAGSEDGRISISVVKNGTMGSAGVGLYVLPEGFQLVGLPTSAPCNTRMLWDDNGTMRITP